jgi:hypothetical protein
VSKLLRQHADWDARKEYLPQRAGKLRSRQMKIGIKAVNDFGNSTVSADFSSLLTAHCSLGTFALL